MQKTELNQLAIMGGSAGFKERLHVGRPNIGERTRLLQRLNDILDKRWLTNAGCYVREFEGKVAEVVGVKHCVATCNATIALEIAVRALELKGEVIVPAFTFVATAHALQWQEITPVFADIDPVSHLVDPSSVRRLVNHRTSGIVGVHLWGQQCPTEELEAVACEHGLKLIFDAAHAFACGGMSRMVGTFGDAEVFSFHATKFVNTLEGGAIVTNNDELASKMRLMKNFGFRGYDDVSHVGTNGKMNEFSAAMGLTSLEAMAELIAINRRNFLLYRAGLGGLPGVHVLDYSSQEHHNYQYIVVEIDPDHCPIARDRLLDALWAENVLARRYFYPGCHRMEPYRSLQPDLHLSLPITEAVCGKILLLPTGQTINSDHVNQICDLLRLLIGHGEEVMRALETSPFRIHQTLIT